MAFHGTKLVECIGALQILHVENKPGSQDLDELLGSLPARSSVALGFDGPVGAMPQEAVGQQRAACFPAHLDDTVLVQPCADVVVSRPVQLFTSDDAGLGGEPS